jgi:hypothetical protein
MRWCVRAFDPRSCSGDAWVVIQRLSLPALFFATFATCALPCANPSGFDLHFFGLFSSGCHILRAELLRAFIHRPSMSIMNNRSFSVQESCCDECPDIGRTYAQSRKVFRRHHCMIIHNNCQQSVVIIFSFWVKKCPRYLIFDAPQSHSLSLFSYIGQSTDYSQTGSARGTSCAMQHSKAHGDFFITIL